MMLTKAIEIEIRRIVFTIIAATLPAMLVLFSTSARAGGTDLLRTAGNITQQGCEVMRPEVTFEEAAAQHQSLPTLIGGGFGGFWLMGQVLDEIDATPDIIDNARADMRPAFREFRETRDEIAGILGAATIDRAALEKLRGERIATIDVTSTKIPAAQPASAEFTNFGDQPGRPSQRTIS
jgi:hypothetical protein